MSVDGAFIRVEHGDGPLAAESIPTQPLRVFAGKDLTKLIDGDLKSTGEDEQFQGYVGAVEYVTNLDTEYGSGFVVVAKAMRNHFWR